MSSSAPSAACYSSRWLLLCVHWAVHAPETAGRRHWSWSCAALSERALLPVAQGMATHPEVVAAIAAAIGEDNRVLEGASEDVRRTRGRCRTLEGRLRALLKGIPGEVSEQVSCSD